MPERTRLTPTSERGNLVAWVADDDMGWLMFVTQRGSTNIRLTRRAEVGGDVVMPAV